MLTKKQKRALDFIKFFTKKHGYAPSLEEIKKYLGLSSVSTAHHHITQLVKEGFIKREKNEPRAIEIKKKKTDLVNIPLLGTIAAGEPIESIETLGENISVPKNDIKSTFQYYALRVKGDSMIEDGIFDGDIVVVKSQPTAENGETVVAIIDDNEATLKKIYKEKNKIKLQPANKKLKPFYRKKIEVRGVVQKIIRNL